MSILDYITDKRWSRPSLACNCVCKTTPMQEHETGDWVRWSDHVDAIETLHIRAEDAEGAMDILARDKNTLTLALAAAEDRAAELASKKGVSE